MARILVVEDDSSLRQVLDMFLTKSGHEVVCAATADEGIGKIEKEEFDLLITDLKLGRQSGLDVLSRAKELYPECEVIIVTAYSTVETAIDAMKRGAFDYVAKPFKLEELSIIIEKALERRALSLENIRLRQELSGRYRFDQIIGKTAKMRQVFETIARVAASRTSVLITGESGTGKELVARAIHFNSPRKEGPFVVVNCGAIPDALMESEMFGHVRGAFTGAYASRQGLLRAAHGGTVFLDEIGELSLPMQVKLLRFLQDHTVRPVGSTQEVKLDVRVLAATNKDLAGEVRDGRFREDLYYRLNVIRIHLPPLRERVEDIPYLAQHFVQKFCKEMGREPLRLSPEVLQRLMELPYPGNVRELENIIEHAVTFARGPVVLLEDLPEHVQSGGHQGLSPLEHITEVPEKGLDLESLLAEIEKRVLVNALKRTHGVRKDAAALLGITFRSLRYKLAKYGLGPPGDEEKDE